MSLLICLSLFSDPYACCIADFITHCNPLIPRNTIISFLLHSMHQRERIFALRHVEFSKFSRNYHPMLLH